MVRDADGVLQPASWPEALAAAGAGLAAAHGAAAVVTGGRITREDAYAYAKFARLSLGTNDIDFRARPTTDEETAFLAAHVAGTGLGVTYRDLERAPVVLLAGFEPEEESPIVFLRLRKAVRAGTLAVHTLAPFATRGADKLGATLHAVAPGEEAAALGLLDPAVIEALGAPGAVILVGERLADTAGALTAAAALAERTGARLAWIPRRSGERGALDAGAFPTLLPGGRPIVDAAARAQVAAAWGTEALPSADGRSTDEILRAAAQGGVKALVVGGVDVADLPDPAAARAALDAVGFLVSLEVRESEVTQRADVVLPVPPVGEKSGTFVDWEGRDRPFDAVLDTPTMSEIRVLSALADEIEIAGSGAPLGFSSAAQAADELAALGLTSTRAKAPAVDAAGTATPSAGEAVLATWRHLLDLGRAQDREEALAGTAPRAVVRVSATTASALGLVDGGPATISTETGALTLPVAVTEIVDGVVWVPTNSVGSTVRETLRAGHGSIVRVSGGAA
jgi:NADH-quinone oxidoreductase subunit G